MLPIFDGHLDLAMNALLYERDQTLSVAEIRQRETGLQGDEPGEATISLPDMRRANVRVCVATLIARCKPVSPLRRPSRYDLDYPSPDMAYAAAVAQLAYYQRLEARGEIRLLRTAAQLQDHLAGFEAGRGLRSERWPVGVILTMEGADPVPEPEDLEHWHRLGVRSLMLAHFGQGRYAMGTRSLRGGDAEGPLTPAGRWLLKEMARLRMPLDVTHLCDQSFFEAMDAFDGPVLSSHSNCRSLADSLRQLSDQQIRLVLERDGVLGVALHRTMIRPGRTAEGTQLEVTLSHLAEHIDHVCQLAGDSQHAALGTDLDGGFGTQHCPAGFSTVLDLHRLAELLASRGMSDDDVRSVFFGNWFRFYARNLPS